MNCKKSVWFSLTCIALTYEIWDVFRELYDEKWDLKCTVPLMGPTWGPSGADRTQVGPILAPWTLRYGVVYIPPPPPPPPPPPIHTIHTLDYAYRAMSKMSPPSSVVRVLNIMSSLFSSLFATYVSVATFWTDEISWSNEGRNNERMIWKYIGYSFFRWVETFKGFFTYVFYCGYFGCVIANSTIFVYISCLFHQVGICLHVKVKACTKWLSFCKLHFLKHFL